MQNLKERANEILNSKKFVILIGVIIFIKTMFFYSNTITAFEDLRLITTIGTLCFGVSFICFLSVLPNKARIIMSLIVDFIISVILFADNVYYTFSNSVISIAQITNLQYAEEITSTLPSLIKFKHSIYFVDIFLFLIMFIIKIFNIEKNKKYKKKQSLIIGLIGIVLLGTINLQYIKRGVEKSYNKDEQIAEATIFGYHISDIYNSINYKNNAKYKTYDEMIENYNELKNDYDKNYGEIKYDFKGCLENKNIIILQLESIQEFVVDAKINGKEITPKLNKFLKENITFSNMHMQSYSSTADSEYSTVTSTYPMENGMSYSRYYTNSYDDIFKLFNKKDYYTSYMHGNDGTFWNRENVYSRMDLDKMIFIDEFDDISEKISGYLSDELFYKQAVQKLKEQTTPYMSFLVAASSHTPFTLEGIENKDDKVTIDVGEYKHTHFGDYLEAVNYADYAFGILIDELKKEGLYEDTAILIFGDHNGFSMYEEEWRDFLKKDKPNLTDVDVKLKFTRMLCGMKIPGVQKGFEIEKVVNKLDIKPTFAYLCGLEDEFSLGTNMFGSKDFVCLNNERIIAQDYYFDEQWYYIETGEIVELEKISESEQQKLQQYYDYMKKELEISFSVNINDLLKKN